MQTKHQVCHILQKKATKPEKCGANNPPGNEMQNGASDATRMQTNANGCKLVANPKNDAKAETANPRNSTTHKTTATKTINKRCRQCLRIDLVK